MFLRYNKTETPNRTIEEGVSYSIHQSTIAKGIVHTRLALDVVTRETNRDSNYMCSNYCPQKTMVRTLTITTRKSSRLVEKIEGKFYLEIQKYPANMSREDFNSFCVNLFDTFTI